MTNKKNRFEKKQEKLQNKHDNKMEKLQLQKNKYETRLTKEEKIEQFKNVAGTTWDKTTKFVQDERVIKTFFTTVDLLSIALDAYPATKGLKKTAQVLAVSKVVGEKFIKKEEKSN